MDKKLLFAGLGLGLGLVVLVYALFSAETEEEKMRRVLNELATAVSFHEPIENPLVHGARLQKNLEELVAQPLQVELKEAFSQLPSEPRALALAASQALLPYGALHVSYKKLELHTEAPYSASGVVQISAFQNGEPKSAERPIHFEFTRLKGEFLVSRIQIDEEL